MYKTLYESVTDNQWIDWYYRLVLLIDNKYVNPNKLENWKSEANSWTKGAMGNQPLCIPRLKPIKRPEDNDLQVLDNQFTNEFIKANYPQALIILQLIEERVCYLLSKMNLNQIS